MGMGASRNQNKAVRRGREKPRGTARRGSCNKMDDVDAATSNLLVEHLHRLAHLIIQGTQRSKGFLGMRSHPSRAVPVKRKRRGDEDDADGPLLDLEATVLFTGLLEVRSTLLAVSVFMAGLSSRESSLLLYGVLFFPS